MAKNIKGKPKFGIMDNIPVPADTHEHTHTHTPEVIVKPVKDRRIQILTYGDLIQQMDSYAKSNGMSRAEVFELAVKEFLEKH